MAPFCRAPFDATASSSCSRARTRPLLAGVGADTLAATTAGRTQMRRTTARLTVMAMFGLGVALAGPSPALADSASITDFKKVDAQSYSATFGVTSDGCRPDGVCGWFAYAVQGPGDQPCTPYVEGDGRLSWTGQAREGAGTFTESATFVVIHESVALCVYVDRGEGSTPALVGELRTTVATELGKTEAMGQIKTIIRRETGAKPTFLKLKASN